MYWDAGKHHWGEAIATAADVPDLPEAQERRKRRRLLCEALLLDIAEVRLSLLKHGLPVRRDRLHVVLCD